MLQSWFLGFTAALGIKFTSSVDDVVWLAPFLTSNSSVATRLHNSTVYIGICLLQTLVAMLIAYSGEEAVNHMTAGIKDAWSTEKIMTVGAGILLGVYSLKLLHEYIQELREGGEEEGAPDGIELANMEESGKEAVDSDALLKTAGDVEAPRVQDAADQKASSAAKSRQQALYCIAFVGSVDDLTLFVPMLVGKGFDVVQLVLGAFTAAATIVLLCVFIGLCKPIADFLTRVPLFLVVMGFAALLLFRGFSE